MNRYDSANPTRIHSTAVNPLHALGPLGPRALSVPETEGSASAKRKGGKETLKVPQIELRVRCHERLCELSMRVATRRRLHEDPRRVNHPLVRYNTAPVVSHYPAFVPDPALGKRKSKGLFCALRKIPNAWNHTKCPYPTIEKGNTVGDELMDELKYCVEAEK